MKRFFFFLIFLFAATGVHAQSIQLSTYYPSPFGKYDRIQLVPRPTLLAGACDAGAQGTLYIDENSDQVMLCDAANWVPLIASGSWTEIVANNTLYVTNIGRNVGLGTTTPTSRLHINAPQGDSPPGVFLENTDITASGGTDGVFGLRNTNTGTTPMISIGGPGLGTETMVVDTQNNRVGIGTTTPNNRIQVTDLINFDNARMGTALGYQAGKVNTGNYNTFLGYQAGLANTTGGGNTFVGISAGGTNTIGTWNVFIGQGSGQSNFLSSYNTFLGTESGFNTTGGNNTFLGYRAGLSSTTGNNNILIGYNVNAPTATTSNFLGIGGIINGDLSTGNIGIGTTTPRTKLELSNDGAILATGTLSSGWTEPNLGVGTRLLWYPRKAAFRAGGIDGTQWNDVNIGTYSVATGYKTTASGAGSTAMGYNTTASGSFSTAMGYNTMASLSANESTAMGSNTMASGGQSTAMGSYTTASGSGSTAMGAYTATSGNLSTAMGYNTRAQAYVSVVLGQYNVISGNSTSWIITDPLFVIGNGTSAASPSNALTVYKNGNTEITGRLSTLGGLVIETRTTNPGSPATGQMWLCTDTGDATPCNGI